MMKCSKWKNNSKNRKKKGFIGRESYMTVIREFRSQRVTLIRESEAIKNFVEIPPLMRLTLMIRSRVMNMKKSHRWNKVIHT